MLQQQGVLVSDNALVGQLMEQILQEYADLGNRADDAAFSYMTTILNLMSEQERYLEKNYAREFSLDELADEMDYHKSYLCVAFKKETQMTIVDCLNMIRVRRAVELIAGSDQNLSQVATMCGFASDSHFTRTFAKYVGVTPGHFRRVHPGSWIYEPKGAFAAGDRPSQFIYNVLAQKQITREMLLQMEKKSE